MMKRHKTLLLEPLETRSLFAADFQELFSLYQSDDYACDVEVSSDLANDFSGNISNSLSDAFASSRSIDKLVDQMDFFGPARHNANSRSIRSDFEHEFFANDTNDSSFQIAISPPQNYSVVIVVDRPVVNSAFLDLIGLATNLHAEAVTANATPPASTTRSPNAEPVSTIPSLVFLRNSPASNNSSVENSSTSNNGAASSSLAVRPNESRPGQRLANVQSAIAHTAVPDGEADTTKSTQASTAPGVSVKSSVNSSESLAEGLVDASERPWASADRQRVFALYGKDEIESVAIVDMLPLEWLDSSDKAPRVLKEQASSNKALDAFDKLEFDFNTFATQKYSKSLTFNEGKSSSRHSPWSSDRFLIPADMVLLDMEDTNRASHEDAVAYMEPVGNREIVLQSGLGPMAIFQIFINEDPLNASAPLVIPNLDFTLHDASNKQYGSHTEPKEVRLNAYSSVGAAILTTVTIVGVTNYIREHNRQKWKQANMGLADEERSSLSFLRNFPK